MRASTALGFLLSGFALAAGTERNGVLGEAGAPGARRRRPRARRRDARDKCFDRTDRQSSSPPSTSRWWGPHCWPWTPALAGGSGRASRCPWRWDSSPSWPSKATCSARARGYHGPAFPTLAPHTALCFVALAIGVFIVRPTAGLMRTIAARRDRRRHASAHAADLADPAAGDRVGAAPGRARRLFRRGDGTRHRGGGDGGEPDAARVRDDRAARVGGSPEPRRRGDRDGADPPAEPCLRGPQQHQPRHRPRAEPVDGVRAHLPHRRRAGRLLRRLDRAEAGHAGRRRSRSPPTRASPRMVGRCGPRSPTRRSRPVPRPAPSPRDG